jgi:cytochrome b561
MQKSNRTHYGSLAQIFHWLTAILVLIAFIYGPGGSELRVYLPSRNSDRQLHETLGLCVFALAFLRVAWRLVDRQPDPPQVARWMSIAGKSVQGLLYLLLFAVPITAIAGAWLEGHPLTLLAGLQVPAPIGVAHDWGLKFAKLHTQLGDAIIWLAGLHALAAIYHHLIVKDGVLVSMLPRWFPLRQPDGR